MGDRNTPAISGSLCVTVSGVLRYDGRGPEWGRETSWKWIRNIILANPTYSLIMTGVPMVKRGVLLALRRGRKRRRASRSEGNIQVTLGRGAKNPISDLEVKECFPKFVIQSISLS